MPIKLYGTVQTGAGGKALPFARAVEADVWLYVSGQVAMEDGEIIDGNIIAKPDGTRDVMQWQTLYYCRLHEGR
ncbi:hypothetical protein ACC689_36250, partial [Rhizobium ruizarguesonis]